jgi:hypothetical protein
MLSSDESRVHRRALLQVQERLLTKQSQELIDGSALESLRDSALSSASTNRSSGQSELLRPHTEPKPFSNSDLVSVFKVPSRSSNISFGSASKLHLSPASDHPYVPRDHTGPEAVVAGHIPALLFRPVDAQEDQDSRSRADNASASPGSAALSNIYSQDKRFPPLLDGSDSSQMASPRGENPARPKSLGSPRGVTVVPYSLPDSQSNVAVDVVWRRSRSFTDLSNAEERTPLKSRTASSTYDSVAAPSGHLQVNLLALNFWFSLFMSFVNCLLTFFIQLNKLDQALTPVVKVAVVAILLAALVGLGYFSVRHLSSFSGNV